MRDLYLLIALTLGLLLVLFGIAFWMLSRSRDLKRNS
jgi:hypothetical protein